MLIPQGWDPIPRASWMPGALPTLGPPGHLALGLLLRVPPGLPAQVSLQVWPSAGSSL